MIQPKKRTLFYLVDGAHSEVLPELIAKGQLPNIKRIIDEGTYRKASSCFPSTTGPAYLPFLTGHFPGTMGITGIRWFDKTEFKKSRLNKYAMRSYCGPEAAWFNTDMPADKPTLFELLGESYNLYSMITRNVPDENDLGKKGKGLLYTRAHFWKRHHPVDQLGHQRIMEMLQSGKDFDFLFAVFPSVDWDSHYYDVRDERTLAAYKIVDDSVGEVRAILEKKGWWDDTLFILTSDHGLTPTHTHFDVADWMTAHQLKSVYYPVIWKQSPKSAVMISGNSFGSIHLLNHMGNHALREAEILTCMGSATLQEFINEKAVDFVIYRGNREQTYIVHNADGKAVIETDGRKFIYSSETADPLKLGKTIDVIGHRAALEATFESDYPDSLFQIYQLFQSRRAGDIVVSARVGYDLRDFWEFPEHKGSHGSLHKLHMHVPLIYNQKGWHTHAARTADLFNSILKWKGITPQSSEGEPLFKRHYLEQMAEKYPDKVTLKPEAQAIIMEDEKKQDATSVFNKKLIIRGSLWFALITIITIAAIFFYTNTGSAFTALSHISYPYIALCLGMLFIDLMLGGWRNHIFIRKLHPAVSQWVSFKANVANMFMGAVTPAHGGAGPAQIYVYTSHGVTFINAFAITLINLGATLIFMPLAGFIAILVMDTSAVSGIVPPMLRYGFSFFLLFLLAFLLAFLKPVWIGILIKKIAGLLSAIVPKRKAKLDAWAERSYQNIAKYQQTCSIITRQHPSLFPLSLLITTLLYLNKYCMQYIILLGLGVQASLIQVIAVQVLIQFMIYFAPSPGGSGFAELSISVLFGKMVPAALLPVFTLLQRSFLLFFPAIIGAYTVINLLSRQAKKVAKTKDN